MLENTTGMENLANSKSGTNTVLYGEKRGTAGMGGSVRKSWGAPLVRACRCVQHRLMELGPLSPNSAPSITDSRAGLGAGGGGVGVCRSHWLSTDHRKMDARESYNYDKFSPSILQLAPSPHSVSLFCEQILIDMQFTHNNPPPPPPPPPLPAAAPPTPHWPILFPQQVHKRVTNVCGKAPLYRASQQPTTTPIGSSISASLPETAFR